jgi:hypothetical protein
MIFHRFLMGITAVLALAAVFGLAACTPGMTAAVASLREMAPGRTAVDAANLDPKFAYLRVTRGNRVGFLWRGSIERTPEGLVEVYYSGTGEVLRLRDGRLVGASGLATEWRRVEDRAPAWRALVTAREPAAFARVRDVMPGYRSGVRDELLLHPIEAPRRSALQVIDPRTLTWFEERTRSRGFELRGTPADTLPAARYALDLSGSEPAVVYSEQCVAKDLCFTWQRWSLAMQKASTQRR